MSASTSKHMCVNYLVSYPSMCPSCIKWGHHSMWDVSRCFIDRLCSRTCYIASVHGVDAEWMHKIRSMWFKKIIRIVCNVPPLTPSASLFRNEYVLTIKEVYIYMVWIFVFKSLYIRDFGVFTLRDPGSYDLRSESSIRLVVPFIPTSHSR